MPRQGSPSPHRRPQLTERQSSTQSLSKGSPTVGHLSKSHKGSSPRLHKAYAVGHGRHPHARVPSYGKGLHKLSKLRPGEPGDVGCQANHNKSASSTPTGSPTSQKFKRNSSNVSLPRTGSKVSMKKNASNVSLTRDVLAIRLGNQQKSEKAQTKNDLRKDGTNDRPLKGQASFELGDEEEQDEDWTEDNSSQSPNTTRQSSARPKSPLSRDPPSPDEETPDRSPQNLPHSPPQSPPTNPSAFTNYTTENDHSNGSPYSHPPNAEDVTHRILNRSTQYAAPTTSNISANITPSGSTGSPPFAHSHTSTIAPEPSMPADGISRFLTSTGSSSGSATPTSVSQLQSTLAHLNHGPTSPPRRDTTPNAQTSRRIKSAANLSHPRINCESGSVSPPKQQRKASYNLPKKVANPWAPRISPYESARAADPSAGKSLTQLRLDLQRMSSQREVTPAQQPLMQHGSVIGMQNLSAVSSEMAARLERQYQQAQLEYRNWRRFYPELLVGNISRRNVERTIDTARKDGKMGDGSKKQKTKTTVGSGSSGERRGRVRFEAGASPGKDLGSEEGSFEGDGEGVEGLLRRMWVGSEGVSGEE